MMNRLIFARDARNIQATEKDSEIGMTEREQVIAELQYLKHDCLEGSATDQTLDKAIALLKAQEPVKPVHEDERDISPLRCGNCGAFVFITNGYKAKYCFECGKAVKWE